MVKFEISCPSDIRNDPIAYQFLVDGASGFGGSLNVEKILNNFDQNSCLLIIVKMEDCTVGAIYLTFTQQESGKVMTSVLLGGDKFSQWASELSDFYYKTAELNGCAEFMLMGRRGFKRYFPELKEVATVFRVSVI